jgi:hypothetical protein
MTYLKSRMPETRLRHAVSHQGFTVTPRLCEFPHEAFLILMATNDLDTADDHTARQSLSRFIGEVIDGLDLFAGIQIHPSTDVRTTGAIFLRLLAEQNQLL